MHIIYAVLQLTTICDRKLIELLINESTSYEQQSVLLKTKVEMTKIMTVVHACEDILCECGVRVCVHMCA